MAKGHPLATLEKICSEWNVTKLMFQADRDMRSFIVEDTLEKLAHSMNIEVRIVKAGSNLEARKLEPCQQLR